MQLYPYHWSRHLDKVAETLSKELDLSLETIRQWPEKQIVKMADQIALCNAQAWDRARQVKANRLGGEW